LNSIVHIRRIANASKVFSSAVLEIETGEKRDIERYIDAKRGEIYFGKAIILAEGITEEYLLSAAADLLGNPLDDYGIVICNINSTNFKPYVQLLNTLNIPWILFTDGDYYENVKVKDIESGEDKIVRKYHIMSTGASVNYRGNEIVEKLLVDLDIISSEEISDDYDEQDKVFRKKGCFIGRYTFEVDMMIDSDVNGIKILKSIYSELIDGGKKMQQNFEAELDNKEYWNALKKIENNISKGRFAQRLANELIPELIPEYIKLGINQLISKVQEDNE